ncbi:uncharacterized protein GGS22DRAFT_190173 [Annulohypoxylon maeteangense]|uniref:uncharacterized protein n=1 Tax=Annulohypoxylon maeteangense TaxID=1927788 RepID=UPI0020078D28|nr:uncharacterized protein GGS22DRAFT_190173 [Annulohypoxylon maeteangense]KAI0883514.1 hypothetical protein GGS22DRAFT_190173 [Annulohypoxylon maeteangense]
MSSNPSSQSQNDIKFTIRVSIEEPSEPMSLPYDEMDVDNEYDSSSVHSADDKSHGTEESQTSRTPSPEIDPESYATWGREHFGEEWYRQRSIMLNERNIFMSPDPVYKQRQSALRMLERQIEGRTFMLPHGSDGETRLLPTTSFATASPSPMRLDDTSPDTSTDTDTASETSSSSSPSPPPPSPHQRLEHYRQRLQWDDLEYHIEAALLEESLIDLTRSKRDDAEGDRRREWELEAMHSMQKESWEYQRQKQRFRLRALGWSPERIEAKEREDWEWVEEERRGDEEREDEVSIPSEEDSDEDRIS